MNKTKVNALLAIMIVGSLLTGCSTKEELYVKDVTVELGDEVVLKADNYLDEEKSVLKEETEVTLDTTDFEDIEKFNLDTDTYVVTTLGKDYLEVGEYDIVLKANELESTGKLIVEDTTAPEFIDFKDTIKVEENAENVDLTKYFKAKDLSEVEISVDQGSFDISKPGTYDIKVTAKDEYENKTEKDSKVVVVETEKAEEEGNLTETTEGNVPVSQQTQQNINNGYVPSPNTSTNSNGNTVYEQEFDSLAYWNVVNGQDVFVQAGPPGACDASFPAGYMDRATANATAQAYIYEHGWDEHIWGYILNPYVNGCGETYYSIQYKYK